MSVCRLVKNELSVLVVLFVCLCCVVCVCSTPSRLSAVWFEPEWRATATAIGSFVRWRVWSLMCVVCARAGTLANDLGVVVGFATGLWTTSSSQVLPLLLSEAAVCVVLLAATLVWFPERPPTPPSPSVDDQVVGAHLHTTANPVPPASQLETGAAPVADPATAAAAVPPCTPRASYWQALKTLTKDRHFVVLALCYGLMVGM